MMGFILQVLSTLLGIFVKNAADKAALQKKILNAFGTYEGTVSDAAKLRENQQALQDKLDDAWQAKWGEKPATDTPLPTQLASILVPALVQSGVPFKCTLTNIPVSAIIVADGQWTLLTVGTANEYQLTLTDKGSRLITVVVAGRVICETKTMVS
jgi:hypothetical protein